MGAGVRLVADASSHSVVLAASVAPSSHSVVLAASVAPVSLAAVASVNLSFATPQGVPADA
jgi:hypothetical protein